ncbi:MAG: hypothetical protein AAGA48_08535 [Myxococcota bacterium]
MQDWPAAHSMDTEWFAVDEHGHVARFDTGESGAVLTDHDPEVAFDVGEAVLRAALARAGETFDDTLYWMDVEPSELGIFAYEAPDYGVEPYECDEPPENPLLIDDLPPEVQPALVRLPIRFADEPELPVGAYIPVHFWVDVPFYEDVDGMARPIVGREAEFAALIGSDIDAVPIAEAFAAFEQRRRTEPHPEGQGCLVIAIGVGAIVVFSLLMRWLLWI